MAHALRVSAHELLGGTRKLLQQLLPVDGSVHLVSVAAARSAGIHGGMSSPRAAKAQCDDKQFDTPQSSEPRRNVRPAAACRDEATRVRLLTQLVAFRRAHEAARQRVAAAELEGIFPYRTYRMRQMVHDPRASAAKLAELSPGLGCEARGQGGTAARGAELRERGALRLRRRAMAFRLMRDLRIGAAWSHGTCGLLADFEGSLVGLQ
ncbi:MAG TPA: hypothetical protein VFQ61_32985 [Polyangiaceae bacterium]|nr:hypothetical protein [Polyangiaceae bacterium]